MVRPPFLLVSAAWLIVAQPSRVLCGHVLLSLSLLSLNGVMYPYSDCSDCSLVIAVQSVCIRIILLMYNYILPSGLTWKRLFC